MKPREELFKLPPQKAIIEFSDGTRISVRGFEVVSRRSENNWRWQALFIAPRALRRKGAIRRPENKPLP